MHRIASLIAPPYFKVKVGSDRPSRPSQQSNDIPSAHARTLLDLIFLIVRIHGRQSIGMLEDNYVPVPRQRSHEKHISIESRADRAPLFAEDVDTSVVVRPAGAESRGNCTL